ncbi:ankyrin-1-like [Microplitis mediator]|uniref:ankyrin-1-like n=1 Tax=Microplitis mediator TaxID=375433 RepID=UPI002554222F|nr:ankyrin-1-like [Microplitis mediator]
MDDLEKYYDMMHSIKQGNTQKVRDIIEEFGLSSCSLWDDGYQLLTATVEKNQVEIVAYSLQNNAKVNSDREVLPLLQIAAMNNNTKIFKILLEHGAKISNNNISPIKLAVEYDNIEIVKLIVKHKNFGKKYDQSLLHTAVKKNNFEMVSLLLEIGADVNEYDEDRSAPIHHAVEACNNDILQLLLDYGADINAKNKYGNTPLCLVLMVPMSSYNGTHLTSTILREYLRHLPGNPMNKSKLDILLDNDADINGLDIRKYISRSNRGSTLHHVGGGVSRVITITNSSIIRGVTAALVNVTRGVAGSVNGSDENSSSENKKCIIKHIVKLRSRNTPLSNNNNMLLSSLIKHKPLDDYKKICEQELSRAMMEKIPNSGISFYNILSKNSDFLAAYAKNINYPSCLALRDYEGSITTSMSWTTSSELKNITLAPSGNRGAPLQLLTHSFLLCQRDHTSVQLVKQFYILFLLQLA